jgi:hypothetical protein
MRLLAIPIALALTGCAHEYAAYAEAHKARAQADAARYAALAEIAKMGDTTAKVAAVISLNAGGGQQPQQIATPRNWADYALSFTGALLPVVGQMYAVNKQTGLGIRQSDNATLLGISQANSNRDVQTATVTGFSSMAGLGFKATADIAAKIQAPQPNITISGTGIVGGGTLTTTTNTMSNSTGVLGTGTYSTDYRPSTSSSTSTSTSTSTSSSLTCTTGPC